MANPARVFPTFSTNPLDGTSGTLDAKEFATLINDMAKWALGNTAVTLAHTGSGTANAIACTSTPAISAYAADQTFWLVPTADNTGAVTIVIDGQSSRAVVTKAGAALSGGELVNGTAYLLWDNGTHLRIMNPDAAASAGGATGFTRILNAVSISGASYSITDFDYDEAWLFIKSAEPSGANADLRLLVSDDNGSTDETAGYTNGDISSSAYLDVYDGTQWDSGTPKGFLIHIVRVGSQMLVESQMTGSEPTAGFFDNGNDVDALKLYPSAGTFTGTLTAWAK